MLSLFVILSLSLSHPTQYRNHDDIQFKKEGRKREKKHMEEEASLEMQQTQECPFHYFSSSFCLFFVLSVTEFAHSFSIGACSCEEVDPEDLTLC